MNGRRQPVAQSMSAPAVTVGADDDISDVYRILSTTHLSSVGVVGKTGALCGVVSRRDLLRLGRAWVRPHHGVELLDIPPLAVADVMSHPPVIVAPHDTVATAATRMAERRIHRVYVVSDERPVGVWSTREALAVVRDLRLQSPLSEWMTPRPVTVEVEATLASALVALESGGLAGVVVTEDGLPVGFFTEAEALAARDHDRDARIDSVSSAALLTLPARTPLFRAAAFAVSTRARRIAVVDGHHLRGVVTGLDFCRALALGPEEDADDAAA